MTNPEPYLRGALSGHPRAQDFAREVYRVHKRYATEVVGAYRLCPHMHDADTGFGQFCVILDTRPELESAKQAFLSLDNPVVHLVFPLLEIPSREFEDFATRLSEALRPKGKSPPIFAAFHPKLPGDRASPHRLVRLLRHAPDPFIQFIPEMAHKHGTVFAGAGAEVAPREDPAQVNFDRLTEGDLTKLFATLEEIHADRQRSYQTFSLL